MEVITSAYVKDGKLTVRNRQHLLETIARWKDGECIVTVERAHATRSKAQNDYYFSVVVERVAEHWKKSPKETHEILKAVYLPHEMALKGLNGTLMKGYVIGGSTAKLDKLQFMDYLEAIVMHFAEHGLVIPDPDPLWRQHAEEEQGKIHA